MVTLGDNGKGAPSDLLSDNIRTHLFVKHLLWCVAIAECLCRATGLVGVAALGLAQEDMLRSNVDEVAVAEQKKVYLYVTSDTAEGMNRA